MQGPRAMEKKEPSNQIKIARSQQPEIMKEKAR
jgi:hypothetical protein